MGRLGGYRQHSSLQINGLNQIEVTDFRVSRPHWMSYGEGNQMTHVAVADDGSISIQCNEQSDQNRSKKEAWGSLTQDAARVLMHVLQEKFAKIDGGAR